MHGTGQDASGIRRIGFFMSGGTSRRSEKRLKYNMGKEKRKSLAEESSAALKEAYVTLLAADSRNPVVSSEEIAELIQATASICFCG